MPVSRTEVNANFPLAKVDAVRYAQQTISSRAFYFLVSEALSSRKMLSVVRMGDGERQILLDRAFAMANGTLNTDEPNQCFDPEWRERMGIEGLSLQELSTRVITSMKTCGFFAPNVNGLRNASYSLYPWYKMYNEARPLVDNFFVNEWDLEDRKQLLLMSRNVLVLHRNPVTANTFAKRARAYLNVGIRHVPISSWNQAQAAIDECAKWDYPLVLVSAGPASKWIIPKIAEQGKVVLDLGNAMDHWLLYELWKANPEKMQ